MNRTTILAFDNLNLSLNRVIKLQFLLLGCYFLAVILFMKLSDILFVLNHRSIYVNRYIEIFRSHFLRDWLEKQRKQRTPSVTEEETPMTGQQTSGRLISADSLIGPGRIKRAEGPAGHFSRPAE